MKEARIQKVHIAWFHLYKVLNYPKLIFLVIGIRTELFFRWEGVSGKRGTGNLLKRAEPYTLRDGWVTSMAVFVESERYLEICAFVCVLIIYK